MRVQEGVPHWEALISGVSLPFRAATSKEGTPGPEDLTLFHCHLAR